MLSSEAVDLFVVIVVVVIIGRVNSKQVSELINN